MKPSALDWLLETRDPSIRYFALVDVLQRPPNDKDVVAAKSRIAQYVPVKRILNARNSDGYWRPSHTCYSPKWTATVWPLMLLGEIGFLPDDNVKKSCERFLDLHQMENGAFSCRSRLEKRGRMEEEPCLTGNMVRTLTVLGYGEDSRVQRALRWMPEAQLEDGGWNCDFTIRKVDHSSFMSTIEPLWAYSEIPRAKWTRRMKTSMQRAAEFMLMHRLYKRDHNDWRPVQLQGPWKILGSLTDFHFPMYYYYDVLHGLRVLSKLGYADDERMRDAVHLTLSKMRPDGTWMLEGDWMREIGNPRKRKTVVNLEPLWKPSKWVTLNCYRALVRTGDLKLS